MSTLSSHVLEIEHEDQIEFLTFSRLSFAPLKKDGIFSFQQKNATGIFVIKQQKTHRIVSIVGARKCVYHILRNTCFRQRYNGIHELSVVLCKAYQIEKVKKAILDSQKKIPLFQTHFEFFKQELLSSRPISVGKIPFVPLYKTKEERSTRASERVQSTIKDFGARTGVYLIKKDGVVVYVGKAVRTLYATVYNHFLPYYDKTDHTRARYFEERQTSLFEIGIIEIPESGLTFSILDKTVRKLEAYLVSQIKPQDNRMLRNKKQEDIWFDEGDFWKPPETILEEAPF